MIGEATATTVRAGEEETIGEDGEITVGADLPTRRPSTVWRTAEETIEEEGIMIVAEETTIVGTDEVAVVEEEMVAAMVVGAVVSEEEETVLREAGGRETNTKTRGETKILCP